MPKNKNYINDVLKKNPDFVFYDYDNECVGDDLIKLIKEVEKKSYEKGFIDGSELTGRIAGETRDKKVDEIINEIEKQDIAKDKVGSFYDGYICFKDQILYYLKNK